MSEEEFQQWVQEQVILVHQEKADFAQTYAGLVSATKLRMDAEDDPSLELLTTYGALLSDQGDHLEANNILKEVVRWNPQFREAYFNYAVTMINIDSQRSGAKEFFEIASQFPSSNVLEAYIDFHGH